MSPLFVFLIPNRQWVYSVNAQCFFSSHFVFYGIDAITCYLFTSYKRLILTSGKSFSMLVSTIYEHKYPFLTMSLQHLLLKAILPLNISSILTIWSKRHFWQVAKFWDEIWQVHFHSEGLQPSQILLFGSKTFQLNLMFLFFLHIIFVNTI